MTSFAFLDIAGPNVVVGVHRWHSSEKLYRGGPRFHMF